MIRFRSDNPYTALSQRLEEDRHVSKEQFREALKMAKSERRSVVSVLLDDPALPHDSMLGALGEFYRLPTVLLRDRVITPYVLNLIPRELAEAHRVVIFKKNQDVIHVATTDPENDETIEFIRKHTGLEPQVFLTTPRDIQHALRRYQGDLTTEFSTMIENGLREIEQSHESAERLAQNVPIVTMVDSIIERALSQNASDIHLEPVDQSVIIRYRVDGLLRKITDVPKALHAPIVSRLKLMSNLKIDEHRSPQDGRFSYAFNNRSVAIRVSIVPTLHGSKIVLRLLDTRQQQYSLRNLGLNDLDLPRLRKEIAKPYGMIAVAGPTGSGKTTTLYTLLKMLNTEEVNICTIEDPIEYGLDGINQTQINPIAGLTFATGLRSLLRQDPNVIMVGEIRDADTADIAVNAAMTGHLVLTTVHANTAAQTIQRLVEMGVAPYLAASVLNCVIAQRLVRKICPHCRIKKQLTDKQFEQYNRHFQFNASIKKLRQLGLLTEDIDAENPPAYIGRGCPKCQNTGYLGRVGIYEMLPMNEDLHATVLHDPNPRAVQQEAQRQNLLNIMEDGLVKAFNGQTTMSEVLRVTK